MGSVKTKWLDRRIAKPGPYLCLCLSEAEFIEALKHLKPKGVPENWVSPGANATVHQFDNADGDLVCVVCLQPREHKEDNYTGVEIAGLLVHEAVHVWQLYAESIGERNPGSEQEAYAIQGIAQELMAEYARRMK